MPPEALRPVSPMSPPAVVSEPRPGEANSHFLLTIFKWHRLILAFGVVVMIAAGIAMLLKPTVPSAVTKILVKTGRDAFPISGLPSSSGRYVYSQEILQTEAEFFASRVVLLPAARALRQERGDMVADSELEEDIDRLRADLVVTLVPNTTVIQARLSDPAVAEAERILRMIVDSYVEQHAVAHSVSAFLTKETDKAAANLRDAEERLRTWQEANNIVAAEAQMATQLATVGQLEGDLKRTEVEIEAVQAQINTLAHDVATLPAQSVTSRERTANPLVARLKGDLAAEEAALSDVRKNPVIERLRMDIATAEVALRDAAAHPLVSKLKGDLVMAELALHDVQQRYRDEDRRVREKLEHIDRLQQEIAVAEREAVKAASERLQGLRRELTAAERDADNTAKERITALRAQLAAAERDGDVFGRETMSPNPLREALNRELAGARARLTSAVSQRDALRKQQKIATTALAELREKRVQFERISREVEVGKALYLQGTNRLEDARIAAGLEKQQLTNIVVIEPPHAAGASSATRRIAVVTMLAAVVGLGLGVAAALALEFFNSSLRTAEDVQFYLGVPVLATVPALPGSTSRPRALPGADNAPTTGSDSAG